MRPKPLMAMRMDTMFSFSYDIQQGTSSGSQITVPVSPRDVLTPQVRGVKHTQGYLYVPSYLTFLGIFPLQISVWH
jgi:hypothetical protein